MDNCKVNNKPAIKGICIADFIQAEEKATSEGEDLFKPISQSSE